MADERKVADGNFVFFGGTSGIGRATALALSLRRANVLLVARNRQAGVEAVEAMRRAGAASAAFVSADLSTIAGMQAAAGSILEWKPVLHGVTHSAMSAFSKYETTRDGFEFAFALQYMARAVTNRLLHDALAASGDGRIVHIAGAVGASRTPDLDDLQYERGKWSFFASILGTHALGFLHIQEAARRWRNDPVTLTATCVGATRTKVMQDKRMPPVMRLFGMIGTSPAKSARNAVTSLVKAWPADIDGAVLRKPGEWTPRPIDWDPADAARLWDITTELAGKQGAVLA